MRGQENGNARIAFKCILSYVSKQSIIILGKAGSPEAVGAALHT